MPSQPEPDSSEQSISQPTWLEGSGPLMELESTLQDLPLWNFPVELQRLGKELAQVFEQHPLLPGAVLVDQEQFVGMISRHRMLEYLLRPHGLKLFLKEPLRVLHSYTRCDVLLLPGTTPILVAAQQALRRSQELQNEPILVQINPTTYYLLDINSLNIAYWQIRGIETQVRYERTQVEMIQSDKMANLGRLVDGVAHEILDPVSFIWGNLSHVSAYCNDLLSLLAAYEKTMPDISADLALYREKLEIDYLRQDLPQTIESIRTGAERLSKLATSLQNFCHIDDVYPKPANLHELIDGMLLLLKSRLSSEIQIIKNYGYLPPVPCYAGQLNQVFINILSNSVDALIDLAVSQQLGLDLKAGEEISTSAASEVKPTIAITTNVRSISTSFGETRWVSICIADNGPGLTEEERKQVLDSFSVQRRAEKETSLSVSYQIVTAKHGGKFEVRSPRTTCSDTTSSGTEFEILLPLT